MTLITSVPQRLALMAWDADERIRFYDHLWRETLDEIIRPAVLVNDEGGEYPPFASGLEEPQERYRVTIVAARFGEGAPGEAELLARELAYNVVRYYLKRPRLQFDNLRQRSDLTRMIALSGVKALQVARQPVTRFGDAEGEGKFWGCQMTVTVTEIYEADEIVVKSPPTLT